MLSSAVMPHHWPSSKNSTAGVQHLSTLMSSNSLCCRISGFDPSVIIASALYFWIYCSFRNIFDTRCTSLKTVRTSNAALNDSCWLRIARLQALMKETASWTSNRARVSRVLLSDVIMDMKPFPVKDSPSTVRDEHEMAFATHFTFVMTHFLVKIYGTWLYFIFYPSGIDWILESGCYMPEKLFQTILIKDYKDKY